jgi:hypothetical protein
LFVQTARRWFSNLNFFKKTIHRVQKDVKGIFPINSLLSLKRLLRFYSSKSFIKSQGCYPLILQAIEQQAHKFGVFKIKYTKNNISS